MPDESRVAELPFVDSSTISKNMKRGKRPTMNPGTLNLSYNDTRITLPLIK